MAAAPLLSSPPAAPPLDWRAQCRTTLVAPPAHAADLVASYDARLQGRARLTGDTPEAQLGPVLREIARPWRTLFRELADLDLAHDTTPQGRIWTTQIPWLLDHPDERLRVPVYHALVRGVSGYQVLAGEEAPPPVLSSVMRRLHDVGERLMHGLRTGQPLTLDGAAWSPLHAVLGQHQHWALDTLSPSALKPTGTGLPHGLAQLVAGLEPLMARETSPAFLRFVTQEARAPGGAPLAVAAGRAAPTIGSRLAEQLTQSPSLFVAAVERRAIPPADAFAMMANQAVHALGGLSRQGPDPWLTGAFRLVLDPPQQTPWQLAPERAKELQQVWRAARQRQQRGPTQFHATQDDDTWRALTRWAAGQRDSIGPWLLSTIEALQDSLLDVHAFRWGSGHLPIHERAMELALLTVPHVGGRTWVRGLTHLLETEAALEGAGNAQPRVTTWITRYLQHAPNPSEPITPQQLRPLLLHRERAVRTRGIALLGQIGLAPSAAAAPPSAGPARGRP